MIAALSLVALATVSACSEERPEGADQMTGDVSAESVQQARADWPAGLSELVDSANAAYSADDFETAAALFRRSTTVAPQITATWFGVYMSEHARGNVAAADSAMARAQSLAPEANLIHDTTAPTIPAGHPPMSAPDTTGMQP